MLGKASKKGRGSASLLFVCANKGELGFSPFQTKLSRCPPRGGRPCVLMCGPSNYAFLPTPSQGRAAWAETVTNTLK